jgi:hypothetical protein
LIKTHPQVASDVTAEATLPGLSSANAATPAPAMHNDDPHQSDHLPHGTASHAGSNGTSSSGNGFSPANAFDRSGGAGDSGFPGLPPAAMRPVPTDPSPIEPAQIDPAQPNPPQQPSLDQRPRLHLGLASGGNGSNGGSDHLNGSGTTTPPQPSHTDQRSMIISEPLTEARVRPVGERHSYPQPMAQRHSGDEYHQPRPAAPPPRPYDQPRHGYDQHHRPGNGGAANKDASGSYIDQELRARVDGDIAAFLSAFDAALAQDTQGSRSALREATDRLLRAGARTRIELERLEARVPLPPRDAATRAEPAWPAR